MRYYMLGKLMKLYFELSCEKSFKLSSGTMYLYSVRSVSFGEKHI